MQKSASVVTNKSPIDSTRVHLIDHYSDSRSMNANKFAKDARSVINDIHKRGKVPILEGGSTFYIKHLFEANLNVTCVLPEDLQSESRQLAKEIIKQDDDYDTSFKRLQELASRPELEVDMTTINLWERKNDFYRLEVAFAKILALLKAKKSMKEIEQLSAQDEEAQHFRKMLKHQFFLTAPRPLLWPLLDLRCEIMVHQPGFFAEILSMAE